MSILSILGNSFQWSERSPHQVLRNEGDHDEESAGAEIIDVSSRQRDPPESTPQRTDEFSNEFTPSLEDSNSDQHEIDSINDSENIEDEDDLEAAPVIRTEGLIGRPSLRELEEEREAIRRRTSVCLLLAIFFLFRLWVEALTRADLIYLMLCMVLTSWCARYIRHNREQEEELDRRIANYGENNGEDPDGLNRPEFRMLSFQAQLALAIMESQRQMMEGGYGHPDGQDVNSGVSSEARDRWERSTFKKVEDLEKGGTKKGEYGSVAQEDGEEEPCCTICLCEYEDGDKLARLPCNHIYCDECITSWTDGHNKCPLCNYDLESIAETESSSHSPSSQHDD